MLTVILKRRLSHIFSPTSGEGFGRFRDGSADSRIGPASTYIPAHRSIYKFTRRICVGCKQCNRRHDLSRLTVAALRNIVFDPRCLDGFRHFAGNRLDGYDFATTNCRCRGYTGSDRLTVNVDGACATKGRPAPELGSFEAQRVSQRPEQRRIRIKTVERILGPVNVQVHGFSNEMKELERNIGAIAL